MAYPEKVPDDAPNPAYAREDWDEVSDNPEWTREDFERAKPFDAVFPALAATLRRERGRQDRPRKVQVTLRLDAEIVAAFKADGPGWQSRINDALADRLKATGRG